MSFYDIIILFLSIFSCCYISVFVRTEIEASINRANILYAKYVSSACLDTLEQNLPERGAGRLMELAPDECIWEESTVRENAVDDFYRSFGLNLNKDTDYFYHEMELASPVIFLVDTDGYYVCYNAALDDSPYVSDGSCEDLHRITNLHTYSEEVAGVTVRYFLSDYVELYLPSGQVVRGDRRDAADASGLSSLSYLKDDALFSEARDNCVVSDIEDKFRYYVNAHNSGADMYNTHYDIDFTRTLGDTWCGLIDRPGVMAFVQAGDYVIRGRSASVYGQAVCDLGETLHYFIHDDVSGPFYYCYEEMVEKGEIVPSDPLLFRGSQIDAFYTSWIDCAERGAYPGY